MLRCSKTDESESDAEGNCEAEVQGHTSNPASLEVAAIADTDDDYLVDTLVNEQKFINFELRRLFFVFFFVLNFQFTIFSIAVQEESLPEGLLRMGKVLPPLPLTLQQCQGHRIRLRSQFTSTWLSVAAKNIEYAHLRFPFRLLSNSNEIIFFNRQFQGHVAQVGAQQQNAGGARLRRVFPGNHGDVRPPDWRPPQRQDRLPGGKRLGGSSQRPHFRQGENRLGPSRPLPHTRIEECNYVNCYLFIWTIIICHLIFFSQNATSWVLTTAAYYNTFTIHQLYLTS